MVRGSKTSIGNILKDNGYDPLDNNSGKWEKWQGEWKDYMWTCDFFFIETVKGLACLCFILVDTYTKEILSFRVYEGREGIDSFWIAGTIAKVFAKYKRRPQNLIHYRDPLFNPIYS